MEITNKTSTTVDGYRSTYGLQNSGNVSSSSSGNAQAGDSVQLSPSAQVAAMHTNGMTVNQIAANEGLTTAEVDSYLGITTAVKTAGGGQSHAASSGSGPSSSTVSRPKKAAA